MENKKDNVILPKYLTADFIVPPDLTEEEKIIWEDITATFKEMRTCKVSDADYELIRQYCQLTVARNRAWTEYNNKPERYSKIVTGKTKDGMPKIIIKDNEHYKTWLDCNKQIEVLIKDLGLVPANRLISRQYAAESYVNFKNKEKTISN